MTTQEVRLKPMGINWIGLGTIVRREVSRIMRVPIQAFIAPWISALLFIFIFGFVLGGRIKEIGGPERLQMADLTRRVLRARGSRRWVVPVRVPGAAGQALRDGVLVPTNPDRVGQQTFDDWLSGRIPEK